MTKENQIAGSVLRAVFARTIADPPVVRFAPPATSVNTIVCNQSARNVIRVGYAHTVFGHQTARNVIKNGIVYTVVRVVIARIVRHKKYAHTVFGRNVVQSARLASCADTIHGKKFVWSVTQPWHANMANGNTFAGTAEDQLTVNAGYKKQVAPNTAAMHCVSDVSWYTSVLNTTSTAWTVL